MILVLSLSLYIYIYMNFCLRRLFLYSCYFSLFIYVKKLHNNFLILFKHSLICIKRIALIKVGGGIGIPIF